MFDYMATAWSPDCGGGLWWSTARTYKNAITNELFFALSVQLARLFYSSNNTYPFSLFPCGVLLFLLFWRYYSWALKSWQWFEQSGLINSEYLINDGLDANCQNNGGKHLSISSIQLHSLFLQEQLGHTTKESSFQRLFIWHILKILLARIISKLLLSLPTQL